MHHKYNQIAIFCFCVILVWTMGWIQATCMILNFNLFSGIFFSFIVVILSFFLYLSIINIKKNIQINNLSYSTIKLYKVNSFNIVFRIYLILIVISLFFIFNILYNNKLIQEFDLINKEKDLLQYRLSIEIQRNNIGLLYSLFKNLNSSSEISFDKLIRSEKISRIVALSSSEKMSNYWKVESIDCQIIDLKRELLLLNLFGIIEDTFQYKKFMNNVSFYGVDLSNLDLHGMNLTGINLKNSNLENANLEGAILDNANLRNANLIGINLNNSTLIGANLIGAKLNRARIYGSNLHLAKLDSADLSNSFIQKSNLFKASLVNAILCNASLIESNLSDCLLSATYMSNVNFSKTNLKNSEIYDTDIGSAILDNTVVNENWSEQLIKRNTSGVYLILKRYKIIKDSLSIKDSIFYQVKPILN